LLVRNQDGKLQRAKELIPGQEGYPSVNERIKNPEYWKKRAMTYLGRQRFYDLEIKTGVCYLCKRNEWPQQSKTTVLHHLKYEHKEPLNWTIEVCTKCHYKIDEYNRKKIQKRYAPSNFAKAVDKEEERIAFNNLPFEEMMKKYVRGYRGGKVKRKE